MTQSRAYDRILSEHECERCRRWYRVEVERRNAYSEVVKDKIKALSPDMRVALYKTHIRSRGKWRSISSRDLCDLCKLFDLCVEANLLILLLKLEVIR